VRFVEPRETVSKYYVTLCLGIRKLSARIWQVYSDVHRESSFAVPTSGLETIS